MNVTGLKTRKEFLKAARGLKDVRPMLVTQAVPSAAAGEGARVGFTATKKIGGAVVRNRAKRRLREAARQLLPEFGAPGADYVFIARRDTADCDWSALLDDMRNALIRLTRKLQQDKS